MREYHASIDVNFWHLRYHHILVLQLVVLRVIVSDLMIRRVTLH